MIYEKEKIFECIFIERKNRFVATVLLDNEEIDVHVKNTGRCKELLIKGRTGIVVKSDNEARKYAYDLVAIYKEDKLVNIDSQIPNKVVYDFLKDETIFKNIQLIKREVTYKKSRFDIYIESINEFGETEKIFVEVKGVTLFDNVTARFPDAPTQRGAKHLNELVDAIENGYKCYVFFLVQAEGIKKFTGNIDTDMEFCEALNNAVDNGVGVLCYNSVIMKDDIIIKDKVEYIRNEIK